MSLDPKGVAVSNWQKRQSRTRKMNVDVVKADDDKTKALTVDGDDVVEGKRGQVYFLLRGGKLRTPENRKPLGNTSEHRQNFMPRLDQLFLSRVRSIKNALLDNDLSK